MAREDIRRLLLESLVQEGHLAEDQMMKGLAQVIKGERVVERFDGMGNLTSREVARAPGDVARGTMLLDALTGGELGLTPAIVKTAGPVEQMYEEFAPKEFNEGVIQNKGAREALKTSYGTE